MRRGAGLRAALSLGALVLLAPAPAAAEGPAPSFDRASVRFVSPETGGPAHPRFVLQRTLAFEARLEAMAQGTGSGDGYEERDVRTALEHDIAEQMLASLAEKLITDSPADKRPGLDEIPRVEREVGAAMLQRLGGRARVDDAAHGEQLDTVEVDALLHRAALATWYLDRAVTPLLHPTEEQLRDVYRSSAHPYRGQPFENVRDALSRWFVVERVRVAEAAFLQSARSRVKVIVTP
ncbi:MAG TPA: hypothetical protein VIF09_07550 [Polyangiaceae bacterium]